MLLFLSQMRYFLSFLRGTFITPRSIVMFNGNDEKIFTQLFPSTQGEAKHSILTKEIGEQIPQSFEKFLSICDFESMKRIMSIYLTINSTHGIDVISSIVMSKVAIEVLMDKIKPPSFASEEVWLRYNPFDKINEYLKHISANIFFDEARELSDYAKATSSCAAQTPFELVNGIRNDLVHSKQKIIPDMDRSGIILMETLTTFLLFFEKIVLSLLEYRETYSRRSISPKLAKLAKLAKPAKEVN